ARGAPPRRRSAQGARSDRPERRRVSPRARANRSGGQVAAPPREALRRRLRVPPIRGRDLLAARVSHDAGPGRAGGGPPSIRRGLPGLLAAPHLVDPELSVAPARTAGRDASSGTC